MEAVLNESEILKNELGEIDTMVGDAVDFLEEIVHTENFWCKSGHKSILGVIKTALKSAEVTKQAWHGIGPLMEKLKGAYNCELNLV